MPTLVERSLFKIGGGFAITLPKPWIRFYKLKPGDKLEIITDSSANDLVVRVKKEVRESINLRKDLTKK